ncbi:MAG: thioredoxin family protein [candidate division WOR-3 bacterium]
MHILSVGTERTWGAAVPWGRCLIMTALLVGFGAGTAASRTLEQTYLGLSSGPLRNAQLVKLPKGIVLRAAGLVVTTEQVEAAAQSMGQAGLFVALENLALDSLLRQEARTWAHVTAQDSGQELGAALVQAYLRSIAEKAAVNDSELRAFYEANRELFGGADFDQVAGSLRDYLGREKMNEAVSEHVRTISERVPIEIDAQWLKGPARAALDNPVDKARRSGKPTVLDFGADGCGPCDMMTPILEELRATYAGKCNVLFVHVRQEPELARRYGISSIPVQVFFDRAGREVFRHTGYYPKDQMLARLAEIGVK